MFHVRQNISNNLYSMKGGNSSYDSGSKRFSDDENAYESFRENLQGSSTGSACEQINISCISIVNFLLAGGNQAITQEVLSGSTVKKPARSLSYSPRASRQPPNLFVQPLTSRFQLPGLVVQQVHRSGVPQPPPDAGAGTRRSPWASCPWPGIPVQNASLLPPQIPRATSGVEPPVLIMSPRTSSLALPPLQRPYPPKSNN
jgi:hypothetical protein